MNIAFSKLRENTKSILLAIERNESVILTYRGRKKAMIVPCANIGTRPSIKDCPAFGMWDDRKDMDNVEEYVKSLRKGRFFSLS